MSPPTDKRLAAARWLGACLVTFGLGVGVGSSGLAPLDALVAGVRGTTIVATPVEAPTELAEGETPAPVAAPIDEPTAASPASPTAVPVAARERATGAESASAVEAAPPPQDTPVATAEERYAFLLMGYGGGRHEGGYLTDSLMLVIVDPAGPSLTLLSIPRDAWVPMSFDGKTTIYNKVNTAYAFARDASLHPDRLPRYRGDEGAGVFAADTISRLLGVPIRYHAALDFAGFRRAVDALGGVQVDVPTGFAARYPANDDPTIDPSWITVRFREGLQKMDGEAAIRYARARDALDDSGEGGDFARARRQRLIMEAFKARLFEPTGLLQLPRLLKIGTEHLETDYDLPGAAQIAELLLDWRSVRIHQAALTLENYLDEATGTDGAYLLVPRIEERSWAQVRALARRLWAEPALGQAMARTPVTIVNSTGTPGVGGRVAEALARLGYRVETPVTGTPRAASRLIDRTGGEADALVKALMKDLGSDVRLESGDDDAGEGLMLEIGSDDAELADLAPPRDAGAPSSKVGVRTFGQWIPEMDEPAVVATPVATRRPVGTARPGTTVTAGGGTPGASPRASGTPVPAASRTPAAASTAVASGTPGSGAAAPSTRTPAPSGAAASPTSGTPRPTGTRAPASSARTPTATNGDDDGPGAGTATPNGGGQAVGRTPTSAARTTPSSATRTATPAPARSATGTARTPTAAASPPRSTQATRTPVRLAPTVTPAPRLGH